MCQHVVMPLLLVFTIGSLRHDLRISQNTTEEPSYMLDERAQTDESQGQATSNLAWFLTGAFIGAAAAVLYAPQSGKETRKYLSDKTQRGRDAVESAGQDIADVSKDMFE